MNFPEAATKGVLCKKLFFKILQYSQESCRPLKEIPTQVFSSEYCEIFKYTYFEKHLLTADVLLSSSNLLTGYEQLSH